MQRALFFTVALILATTISMLSVAVSVTPAYAQNEVKKQQLAVEKANSILPERLAGGWWSQKKSSWSGGLVIRTEASTGSVVRGTLEFSSSACPGFKPFEGTVSETGVVVITAHLRGDCGEVIIKIKKDGDKWKGTYRAQYPDRGRISLTASAG